ncbi:MAG: glycoside hydrolase family 11 protein [Lachnospiraceae bacterium]|nr:glycoside hydrolase family 11 protein [Lachnospiraceae bacterium]
MKCRQKILTVIVFFLCLLCPFQREDTVKAANVVYENIEGKDGEYTYSLWKDYGTTSMTLNGNGKFECSWQDIGNALFREGIKFDCTKRYSQIGSISVEYGVDYNPDGNSYMCVYGWSRDPLIEYYIVDSWGNWRPPGAGSKGTIEVDGGTYDIYETTRVNQPSIDGNTTFKQYWSVRTSKRTSGTISVTEHFKAWEDLGMHLGNLYETSLTIEGYQSSGRAEVYSNTVRIGEALDEGNTGSGLNGEITDIGSRYECESMIKSGRYAGNIISPFNGAALYANADSVSTTVDFATDKHDFKLRGAANNSNTAKVDLVIDGLKKGTFTFTGSTVSECTIKDVATGTGNHEVTLVLSEDDGTWDAFLDCLYIEDGTPAEIQKPARPVVHANVSDEGSITITIDKTENASGYRIYVKEPGSKKYRKLKTIKKYGGKVRIYTYEPQAKGKYYFKVKAYTKIAGKVVWGKACKAVLIASMH